MIRYQFVIGLISYPFLKIMFDGKKIRDEILAGLKKQISGMNQKPALAVFLIGDDPVSVAYVGLKQRIAEDLGVKFKLYKYPTNTSEEEVMEAIAKLNDSSGVGGIMIQIPLPPHLNRDKLIRAINPSKDVDGLRYCLGLESDFVPPVVLAIEKALDDSLVVGRRSSVVIAGRGFLVGNPLYRYLKDKTKRLITVDSSMKDLSAATCGADVIISATGQAGLIKPEMVKEGVVLIDAGTSEVGGELKGDIDPAVYKKASFYTPVPGGIGPVTVAYLMKNLVTSNGQ